jgi:hypothetical protein
MKTTIFSISFIALLLLFAGLTLNYSVFAQKTGRPVMDFETKIFDLGKIPKDTVVKARFHFTNTGTSPLIIKEVNTECMCTGYLIGKDTIQANEKAYIELTFNSENKQGHYKIYTVVKTNTYDALYKLTLKVNVE